MSIQEILGKVHDCVSTKSGRNDPILYPVTYLVTLVTYIVIHYLEMSHNIGTLDDSTGRSCNVWPVSPLWV